MRVPAEVGPVEVALAWVHLPTGAALVQGVVRHPDGGPIIAGSRLRDRPLGAGGVEVLATATNPAGPESRGPLHPSEWTSTGTDEVQATLERRGWRLLTRAEAVTILNQQGYLMRSSRMPGHVLHSDQADDTMWHSWVAVNGRPFDYIRAVFVVRPVSLLVDTSAARYADRDDTGRLGSDTPSLAVSAALAKALHKLTQGQESRTS